MAKKRQKRRKAGEPRPLGCKTGTMSSEDSYKLQSSVRHSSDGNFSENAISEGALTGMTSIADTDEDEEYLADELEVDEDEVPIDDEDDMISIYPASHFQGGAGSHRTEMPFYSPDHEGLSDLAASTQSLWEQDLDYREIHGRRYCREYYLPNDDIEQLRMALMHQVFLHVLDDEITLVPLENPTNILDVGTGTGDWAIRMAELWPECEVVGTDISAIAETKSVPMNVFFEIEDAEDWDRLPDVYDLIHLRCMEGSFQNWSFIYENIFYSLRPGGWIEVQDFDSADGLNKFLHQFPPESLLHKIMADLEIAAKKSGRPRGPAHLNPRVLMNAGFVDVQESEFVIPITVAEKSAGKIWLISCLDSLEASCLRLLTTYMGWDPDRCKAACEAAARELATIAKDPERSKDLQVKLRVLIGRKPMDAPRAESLHYYRGPISPSMDDLPDEASSVPTILGVDQNGARVGSIMTSAEPSIIGIEMEHRPKHEKEAEPTKREADTQEEPTSPHPATNA